MKAGSSLTIKLLKQIAKNEPFSQDNAGHLEAKTLEALKHLIKEDFVFAKKDKTLGITQAGRSFLRRYQCDASDPYRAQHHIRTQRGRSERTTETLNLGESPLGRLYARKTTTGERLIEHSQFMAGERLRRDFEFSNMGPKLGLTLAPRVDESRYPNGASDTSDNMISARERLNSALNSVGDDMAPLLLDVCCFLKGLETVERERKWPPRSAKIVLGMALRRLADHYGFSDVATGKAVSDRKSEILTWKASQ